MLDGCSHDATDDVDDDDDNNNDVIDDDDIIVLVWTLGPSILAWARLLSCHL